ncbi:borealin-like isoform X1 [Lineus longissimus]|uniref:borealin-like isoform X1 n=1 Tax=Lineus longissimus TaxID=88925 RepID=UPI002B4F184A
MPKRRATRKAPTRKPKPPVGDEGNDLSQEEKAAKLQTFLDDFDREVECRRKEMKEKAEKICAEIHNMMMLEVMKIPLSIREMKFADFMAQGGSVHLSMMEATKATLNEVAEIPAEIITSTKKGRTAMSRRRQKCETISEESEETDEEDTTDKRNTVKKPPRPVRKAAGAASQPPKTTRRTKVLVEQTPASQIRSASAFNYTDTPLVTPRIDPRLIVTPGFSRLPRKQEKTLYCQISETTGSPVKDDNLVIVVSNGEVQLLDKETGRANPVPLDAMKKSDRTKFSQLKAFLASLPGMMEKTNS